MKHIIILNNTTFVIGLPKSYQLIISNIKNVISNDNIAIPITNKIFFIIYLLLSLDCDVSLLIKMSVINDNNISITTTSIWIPFIIIASYIIKRI